MTKYAVFSRGHNKDDIKPGSKSDILINQNEIPVSDSEKRNKQNELVSNNQDENQRME